GHADTDSDEDDVAGHMRPRPGH
ncbi:MAG: hypothetical protein QOE01_546, partial [Actinomycetota bacterium]|nr:hypothetical protein [Actinomycetota bacterium]